MNLLLKISLKSDAIFANGNSVPGLIDTEIEYDSRTGLAFIRGKTLKGLLSETCTNLLFLLEGTNNKWNDAALSLFGKPGSDLSSQAHIHIGNATLSKSLKEVITRDIQRGDLNWQDVLNSMTAIRKQTSVDATTGVAARGLRSSRVLIRNLELWADLVIENDLSEDEKGLLAACIKTLHSGGSGRNRGLGRINVTLHEQNKNDITDAWFSHFEKQLIV